MCGPRPMLSAEPPPRNGIITIHEGWWTGWLLTEGVAGPGIKGPRWRKKETISRLYSGRTSGGRRFLRTMRLLLLLSSLSLFLLLPLHARAYVRESRFFSPFTPLPGSFSLSSILLPPPLLFLSSAFSRPGSLRVPRTLGQSPKGQQEPQGDTQKYDPTWKEADRPAGDRRPRPYSNLDLCRARHRARLPRMQIGRHRAEMLRGWLRYRIDIVKIFLGEFGKWKVQERRKFVG